MSTLIPGFPLYTAHPPVPDNNNSGWWNSIFMDWISFLAVSVSLSVLWRCWLVGRQEGHPACKKTELWGAGVVICLELGADLHMAHLMPLPLTVSCFSKIQIGFTFLVSAHLGSPAKGPLNGCVCQHWWSTELRKVSSMYRYQLLQMDLRDALPLAHPAV